MTTCGELLTEILESYGVDTVFGIPGVHTLELYRGLQRADIRHITPRHEQGAGFMADGYARVTGKPGVCFIITGPGMTNITTAMGQAYGDSIPMLVISSTNAHNERGLGEGHLHELRAQSTLVEGVSAFSQTIMRPDDLPGILARAFAVFNGARPRPVHLEIPIDIYKLSADHVKRPNPVRVSRPGPAPDAVAEAADWLANAEKPVVFLGGGTVDASKEACAVVEALDAPTALTINAKGVLPPGHPLSCGSFIPYAPMQDYLAEADVILAVGTEMGETDYDVYRNGAFSINGKLIRIDIEADQTARNYRPDMAIVSDAKLALAAIGAELAKRKISRSGKGAERAAAIRRDSEAVVAEWTSPHKAWFDAILAAHDDPIIVGDSTQPIYSANHVYDAPSPRSYFNSATGYGTLGYGLPAAIGAKIAAPDRPVVCVSGDGGILFTIGELASAVEAKAGIAILLWNNEGYKTISDYMIADQISPVGCIEFTPDFQTIAKGFGCDALRVETPAELTKALKSLQDKDVPTLIEVMEKKS
ncbi:MAG: 5-guanidino-2-oxopentanoate decarboxylase [Rhodospirillales bacterium]|nr:5-guanidino-2-oxopentanoate decarboxylase [Rhodospirillales bacterium]